MKICGIIVEYNPFTNGHLYHIQKAREITQCDILIACMSGNFTQRGEPAIVDKWERSKVAILNGVDLVVELPFVFACQSADYFAKGAVAILNALGCDSIVFGSETMTKNKLQNLLNESLSQDYKYRVQDLLNQGYSYPQATSLAFQNESIKKPNDILSFCYVKQIHQQKANMDFYPILRKTDYHDLNIASQSASSLRHALKNGQDISLYSPMKISCFLHDKEDLFEPIYQKLLFSTPEELRKIPIVKEGIEYRLLDKIQQSKNMNEFLDLVTTKRYTKPRILRTITHILIHQTLEVDMPEYVRLLACSKNGKKHLRYFVDHAKLPLISHFSQIKHPHLEIELNAAKLYALSLPINERQNSIKKEYASIPYFE